MERKEFGDIRIITLNCWGLWIISTNRKLRLRAIGDRFRDIAATIDIVTLQECWVKEDFEYIRDQVKHELPYSRFFHSGAFGSGLATFSRWPIIESAFHTFELTGKPCAFYRGDFYVGKGAGKLVVRHPTGKLLSVWNTHLHAPYGLARSRNYEEYRITQAWQLAHQLKLCAKSGRIVIIGGDFNAEETALSSRILRVCGNLTDAWLACNPKKNKEQGHTKENESDNSSQTSLMSPLSNTNTTSSSGNTVDWQLNTWQKKRYPRNSSRCDLVYFNAQNLDVVESELCFTEIDKSLSTSYSDHFGVRAKFSIPPQGLLNEKLQRNLEKDEKDEKYRIEKNVSETKQEKTQESSKLIKEALIILDEYMKFEFRTKKIRIFFGSMALAALIALFAISVTIATQKIPQLYAFLLVFLTSGFTLIAFCELVLFGFLFDRFQSKSIMEFVQSMKDEENN